MKTTAALIKERKAKISEVYAINEEILKSLASPDLEPLYQVSTDADWFENENEIELNLVNESFFSLRTQGAFSAVNLKPDTFLRFILACVELYECHKKQDIKQSKVAKLRAKKRKIQIEINGLEAKD